MTSPTQAGPRLWSRAIDSLNLPPGPRRTVAWSTLVNSVGTGMFVTASALYFTKVVGLSTSQVGAGLTTAGFVALTANLLAGRLADRWGARGFWAIALAIEAAAMACFLVVDSFWTFVLVACISQFAASASQTARLPVFRSVGGDSATHLRAVIRTIVNVASSFGALVAGIVIYADTTVAYSVLIVGNALTFAANVLIVCRLPRVPATLPQQRTRSSAAIRNIPFLFVTALNAVLIIQAPVFTFALPLWIATSTDAPEALFAVLVVLNTAVVTMFQIRAARGVDGVAVAGRAMRTAGCGLAGCFVAFGATTFVGSAAAVAVLVLSVAVMSLVEIRYAAAEFELSFGLAPQQLQGEYSGIFTLGLGLATSVGPYLLAAFVLTGGFVGWAGLAAAVLLASLLVPRAVSLAEQKLWSIQAEA